MYKGPQEILELGQYVWMARALIASVELDIYATVGANGATLDEVAEATKSSERGIRSLLGALIPMGLLKREDDGTYKLTDFSRGALLPGSLGYAGGMVLHSRRLWETWADLDETIRSGQPHNKRVKAEPDLSSMAQLAEGLFPRNHEVASLAAEALEAGEDWKGLQILDVAAGSGAWSMAFLKKDPSAMALALDFEPVLDMAKSKAQLLGVADRFEVQAGNIREADFGADKYDLVILGHICHSEGRENSRELIVKSAKSLKSGGKLLIADMLPDEDRRGPLFPMLFDLNMLVNTEEGGVFTFNEYREWCGDAGLKETRLLPLPVKGHSPLVVADKP